MDRIRLGFAFCGSFCTLSKAVAKLRSAVEAGYDVYPIMSFNAYATDTRFGKADDFVSVSYTHLDVYKRQRFGGFRRFRSGCETACFGTISNSWTVRRAFKRMS